MPRRRTAIRHVARGCGALDAPSAQLVDPVIRRLAMPQWALSPPIPPRVRIAVPAELVAQLPPVMQHGPTRHLLAGDQLEADEGRGRALPRMFIDESLLSARVLIRRMLPSRVALARGRCRNAARALVALAAAGMVARASALPATEVAMQAPWWVAVAAGALLGAVLLGLWVRDRRRLRAALDAGAEAGRRLHALVDALDIGLVVYDQADRLVLWNQDFARLYGPLANELQPGRTFEELLRAALARDLVPEARGREGAWLSERLAAHRRASGTLLRALPDGRWRRISERRLADGRMLSYSIDVTELEQQRRAAEQASARLQDAIDALTEGFALYDKQDRLVVFNARYREIYAASAPAIRVGASFEEILRHGLAYGQYPQAAGREEAWLAERLHLHRHPGPPALQELPGNRWLRIDERVTRDGGIAGVRTEVTELVRREQELQRVNAELDATNARLAEISDTDALTGIANRRHFDRRLGDEWARAQRDRQPVALLMVDVDHFKPYNDRHGHPAGDACLRRIAALLQETARRPSDCVARYGGEEFVLLLPHTDRAGAAVLARRCLAAVDGAALPHGASPVAQHVTLSIGVAVAEPGERACDAREMLRRADAALYLAKQAGRHRVAEAAPVETAT